MPLTISEEEFWELFLEKLEESFGPKDETLLFAKWPFEAGQEFGGGVDLVTFSNFAGGPCYVTGNLLQSNQSPNKNGKYELAIILQNEEKAGIDAIEALAYHTLDDVIEDRDCLKFAELFPEESSLCAFLFREISTFTIDNIKANVLCCVGITENEFNYCQKHGTEALLQKLGNDFLITDFERNTKIAE